MKTTIMLTAALLLAGCDLRYALLGFPEPTYVVAAPSAPIELTYREAKGGLVILTGRVNGKADVDFILDTGAPVTVLLDGKRTTALGLDTSKARPLGDPDNPAAPVGDIQPGFRLDFGGVTLSELTAVVVPQKTMPCQERFDEIGFGGVIGADLFRRFVVEIDPVSKRVRLHDPRKWEVPSGATTVPLTFTGGHPFTQVKVALRDGKVIDLPMNIDTGMNRALTLVAGAHPAIAMPPNGRARTSCLVNGTLQERDGEAVMVGLGSLTLPVATPVYSERANLVNGTKAGTLGVTFFRDHLLYIDYPARRLLMKPVTPDARLAALKP